MPGLKGRKRFTLVDTSGLTEGVPEEVMIRRAMAQTLAQVREAAVILHLIDANSVDKLGAVETMGEVDWQVAQFGGNAGWLCRYWLTRWICRKQPRDWLRYAKSFPAM